MFPFCSQSVGVRSGGRRALYASGKSCGACSSRSCERIWKTKGENSLTSCCRIAWKGGKRAASNSGRVAGLPAVMKLRATSRDQQIARPAGRERTHRTRAEMLSNVKWLNMGLLGFLLISPRILVRCERTVT